MKYKEQESSGSKKSAGELTSDRDLVNTELSAVMENLANLNDMCVAKAMPCEEKSQRCAAGPCSLRELKEAREGSVHSV